MKDEKRTIKLPWKVYKEAAFQDLKKIYPKLKDNKENREVFMRKGGYEPDHEVFDIPDYVEFEID